MGVPLPVFVFWATFSFPESQHEQKGGHNVNTTCVSEEFAS
jgi:hypothetical protein